MLTEIPQVLQFKSWFLEKHLAELTSPLSDTVQKLMLSSDYACRHIELLKILLNEDPCDALYTRENYFQALEHLSFSLPQAMYARELRQFRHTQLLRLLLLELAEFATTEEVICSWSDCADALILHALHYCQKSLEVRYGVPRDAAGQEAVLLVLAMGKLGGRELNYSSDVDLIFAYTKAGETDGKEQLENQQFFNKVIQQFTSLMQNITSDGFVFRVDLRLRPNGDSGTLVPGLSAMEAYYQEQGRDWERYAMVKARVITRSITEEHLWYSRLIIPFVYRRYVDFSVIESLRSMKAMIEREVQLNPSLNDIKRGKGGIREVEFIIQSFQLIRGGRMPQLQLQNAMSALTVLKREKLFHHSDALRQAYLFLRRLENFLQVLDDQQTHLLPEDHVKQAQITVAMGMASWDELVHKLHQYQRIITYAFHSVLGKAADYEDEKRLLANQLSSLWQGHIESGMAITLLASLGYANADHCYHMIHAFRHGPRCRRLYQGARMRLDRLMVLLLTELSRIEKTDEVLLQVMRLLENIVGRSVYLALLTENPQVLTELLSLFAHSPFITSLFVNQPFLLEVLLNQRAEWKPQSYQQLEHLLSEKLNRHDDIEIQEEILRQFKLESWLMAARAEFYGFSSPVRISKFLADVAQIIVNQVLELASRQLNQRYPEMQKIKAHFAIIAYGTLGSREMNYTSDLDLVFLHAVDPSNEVLITRLTQKILHMLTTRSRSGVLYTVDTRLRPSGSAGLLVSHIDVFAVYQKNQAWTWEHQALLKARMLIGNSKMRRVFLQLKKDVLLLPRNKQVLQQEILDIRVKIEQYQLSKSLHRAVSSLWDLEFLVQYLVLNQRDPALARSTHVLKHIHYLFLVGVLNQDEYSLLNNAYEQYHQLLHQSLLRPGFAEEISITDSISGLYKKYLL